MKILKAESKHILQSIVYIFFLASLISAIKHEDNQTTSHLNSMVLKGCHRNQLSEIEKFTLSLVFSGTEHMVADCAEWSHDTAVQQFSAYLNQLSSAPTKIKVSSIRRPSLFIEAYVMGTNFNAVVELIIEDVDLSRSPDFFTSFLKHLTQLRKLRLAKTKLTSIPDNFFLNFSSLVVLDLYKNNLHNLSSNATFHGLATLEELILSSNQLKEIHKDLFKKLHNLKNLQLGDNEININKIDGDVFLENKNLIFLNLTVCFVTPSVGGIRNALIIPQGMFRGNYNLRELLLRNNSIQIINPDEFLNLSHLSTLDLHDNQLEEWHISWFRNLRELKTLKLGQNVLNFVPGLFSNLSNLTLLDLADCELTDLNAAMFFGLTNLRILSLAGNSFDQLKKINPPFINTPKLETIYLNNCKLRHFDSSWFTDLASLKFLDLRGDNLKSVSYNDFYPLLNRRYSNMLVINLTSSSLNRLLFRSIELLPDLNTTAIGTPNSSIHLILRSPTFCDLDYLASYVRKERAISISYTFPNTTSRATQTNCSCEGNFSPCSCEFNPREKTIKIDCSRKFSSTETPSLDWWPWLNTYQNYEIEVDMSQNNLKDWPMQEKSWLFDSRVRSLNLSSNRLTSNTFRSYWHEMFPSLKHLDLTNNRLQGIPAEWINFLKSRSAKNLTVYCYGNDLKCECSDRYWLEPYLINAELIFERIGDINELTCVFNNVSSYLLREEVQNISHIMGSCSTSRKFVAFPIEIVLVTTIFVLVTVIISVIIFLRMGKRSVLLSKIVRCVCLASKNSKQIKLNMSTLKEYDAFISYSHKDEEFVMNELVPKLESPIDGSPKYRLCLHERDWLAGEWIYKQIDRSIVASERTIVILTENFIESFWGQHEFRVAYQEVMKSEERRLIVIIKDRIPDLTPLDDELRLFISNNTYLKWNDPSFWKRLRESLPVKQNSCASTALLT